MQLKIYNSLSGEKEVFTPIHDKNVGMSSVDRPYTATCIWEMCVRFFLSILFTEV